MAFTSGNDINILQSTDLLNVGAGAGNDRYVLDASVLANNQQVTITDTAGANVLQLVGGLVIVSSQVAATALKLTLNNGAVITVLGANTFTFQTGGNSVNGTGGTIQNFADFAAQSLGVAVPATGTATGNTVTVNNDGGTSVTPPAATYALAAGATSADEGTTATFTLSTTNVAAGTKVPYTLTGVQAADVVGGLLTGEATVDAAGKATISVALAADTLTEGAETLTVTLDGKAVTASTTVNDTSLTPVGPTYALAAGATSADEGTTATFTLTTTNVAAGTKVPYTLTGVQAADVVGGLLTGEATVDAAGKATITVALAADATTEGAETLTVTLDGKAVSASTTVNDTSLAPTIFTLTTSSTDVISPTATDAKFKTTSANETISGVNSSLLSEGTLQVTDKIDGGLGNDTLTLSMKQSFAGFTSGSMKDVETVNITSGTIAATEFDASGVTGATKYVIDATTGLVTLKDLDALAAIEVTGPVGTNTFTAAYAAASTVITGGQTDVQTLKVTNTGTIDTDTTAATNAKFLTVDIDNVETLEITTAGTSNSLDLSASANVRTFKVTGEGQTEIAALGAATTSFDASGATGAVIVNTSNAATNVLTTVKTGSGNDSVVVASDDLTANATISGGTGTDTLSITSGGAKTLQGTVSGFETVKVGAITGALTFSGTNATDITTITTEGMGAAASFVNMKALPVTVNSVGAEVTAADKISVDSAAAITYNLNASAAATAAGTAAETNDGDAEFANATSVAINVGELIDSTGVINTGAATDVTLTVASKVVNSSETTKFNDTLTANKATTLTINSKGQLDNATVNAAEATSVAITAGSTATATDTVALVAAKATSVSVTAKQAFDFTGSTLTKAQTVTVDTAKAFTMGSVALADAANITVSGSGSSSKATFGVLGDNAMTHDISLTATGLKSNLETGTITSDTGSATIDIAGVTGNVEIGNVAAKAGITVKASTLGGTLDATTASTYTTTSGNINIDVSSAVGATNFGTLTTNGTTGDVTVTATSALGAVTVGVIKGDVVTVNGQNALNGVTVGNGYTAFAGAAQLVAGATVGADVDIVANTAVNYTGTNLTNNGVNIGTDASSTALVATLAGGAKDESISIAGNTKQTSINVSGNLGAGINSVVVYMAGNTASTDTTAAQTVNLSGVSGSSKSDTSTSTTLVDVDSNITYTGSAVKDTVTLGGDNDKVISITDNVIDTVAAEKDTLVLGGTANQTFANLSVSGFELLTVANNAASVNASALSGDTIAATLTTILTLTDTAGNDTINLANFTHGQAVTQLVVDATAGNDTIIGSASGGTYKGGAGNDNITGGAVADVISGGTGADVISGGDGTDTIVLAADSGSTFGTVGGTFSGHDLITYVKADDSLKFLAGAAVDTSTVKQVAADDTAYVFANNQTVNAIAVTTLAAADFTNVDKAAAFINAVASNTAATGMDFIVAVNDSTAGKSAIYYVVNETTDAVAATEIKLLGITTGDVVQADFIAA